MVRIKTIFSCTFCGATSPKWIGKCPQCNSWNTYQEEQILKGKGSTSQAWVLTESSDPTALTEIKMESEIRIQTGDPEFDRVIGGGIVPGCVYLLGGHPGVGKSTLLLQIATAWQTKVLYVSGEESKQQIKLRADRLGKGRVLDHSKTYILSEIQIEKIVKACAALKPGLVVIDSVQTLYSAMLDSAPGTVSQVRDCTVSLQRMAKETHIPVIIIGHITKEGMIAGPKVLEHIVDTVLKFEGDRNHIFRLLRCAKNRFGSTDELGIYEMVKDGLLPVHNPSKMLLNQSEFQASGYAVGATIEGQRSFLIETQALVSTAVYGTPQRSATGFDSRRLQMLIAVLEKRCGLFFGQSDVFLNIAGGIKTADTAIDLAVLCALISSLEDLVIPQSVCFAGEVGLSGEIRPVTRLEQRILEAERLGFDKIYLSKYHSKKLDFKPKRIEICPVGTINLLIEHLFDR